MRGSTANASLRSCSARRRRPTRRIKTRGTRKRATISSTPKSKISGGGTSLPITIRTAYPTATKWCGGTTPRSRGCPPGGSDVPNRTASGKSPISWTDNDSCEGCGESVCVYRRGPRRHRTGDWVPCGGVYCLCRRLELGGSDGRVVAMDVHQHAGAEMTHASLLDAMEILDSELNTGSSEADEARAI